MLKSLQNDTCSVFIYHSSFSYSHHYNPNQQFLSLLQPIFSSLFHLPACSQNHRYNLHEHSLPLCFICFSSPYFYILPCLKSPPKALSPTSAIQPTQTDSREQGPRESYKDRLSFNLFLLYVCTVITGSHNH